MGALGTRCGRLGALSLPGAELCSEIRKLRGVGMHVSLGAPLSVLIWSKYFFLPRLAGFLSVETGNQMKYEFCGLFELHF